jgi:hypothetical protein
VFGLLLHRLFSFRERLPLFLGFSLILVVHVFAHISGKFLSYL